MNLFSIPLVLGLVSFSNSLACVKPSSSQTAVSQQQHQRLGFRFERLSDALLVTEVLEGLGADQAGIKTGDIIVSVEGLVGEQAIVALQDLSLTMVRLKVQRRGTQVIEEQNIRRGVGVMPPPVVSEWLVSTAKGDLQQAQRLLQSGSVQEAELEKGLRLVARNYPQAYPNWLQTIEFEAPRTDTVLEVLMLGYATEQSWPKIVELYESRGTKRWDLWALTELLKGSTGQNLYANHTIERLYVQALWQLGKRDSAIEHVRLLQPWYASTDLGSIVGMAYLEPTITWSDKSPVASGLKGQDVLGKDWSVAEQDWTVLAFWATWCAPCQKELPELNEWAENVENVNILAVNLNEGFDSVDVSKALTKMGLQEGALRGVRDMSLPSMFDIEALPTLVLLDQQGVERYRMVGYSPLTIAELEKRMGNASVPRVPIATSRQARVEWYPKPGLKDIHWQDGTAWILQNKTIGKVLDWSCWLTTEGTDSCYEDKIVSENSKLNRIFVHERGVATLSHGQKLIEFIPIVPQTHVPSQNKTRWSFGEPLIGWALNEQESMVWTWGQETVAVFDIATGEKKWSFHLGQSDLVQDLQTNFVLRELPLVEKELTHQPQSTNGGLLLTESTILALDNFDTVSRYTLPDKLSSARGITDTHLLGGAVQEAWSEKGTTWVHRQHRGIHSFVGVFDNSQPSMAASRPVVELSDKIESTEGIRLFNVDGSGAAWVLIPNQGVLRLSPKPSNPSLPR